MNRLEPHPDTVPAPAAVDPDRIITATELERALGQTIGAALDLRAWDRTGGLEDLLTRVEELITASVREEDRLRRDVRRQVLSRLPQLSDAPAGAGVYHVSDRHLRDARRNVVLNGAITAADGASMEHDGLAATLVSIGVGLVRYDGRLNSWRTTFLRHDYGGRSADPIEELRGVLDRRARRSPGGPGAAGRRDPISSLLRRALMAAAERKALLEQATSRWRMGHGTPASLELLTGSGSMELIDAVLPVLDSLLLDQTRWVFIPSSLSNRALTTLANALDPGELGIFQKARLTLDAIVDCGTYEAGYKRRVQAFAARAGAAFVIGGLRATRFAPPVLFVAHAERALEAGVIVMADAALQPHRGVPLLLDLAGLSARAGLGLDAFRGVVESAYARAGATGLFAPGRILCSTDAE